VLLKYIEEWRYREVYMLHNGRDICQTATRSGTKSLPRNIFSDTVVI
jgi:hypothetical protein